MTVTGRGRVVVGVDASLSSLGALRVAVAEARQRRTELYVVHVRSPVSAPTSAGWDRNSVVPGGSAAGPVPAPRAVRWADQQASSVLTSSIRQALGLPPSDLHLRRIITVGKPARTLTGLAQREDLLVVGTTSRRWHHLLHRSVSRYCTEHAPCPVLVVPRNRLPLRAHRWLIVFTRARVPRHPWKEFDATASRSR